VDNPRLRHLVDCVVFASKGKHAAPSLSSGGKKLAWLISMSHLAAGDLDGDQYTVIWDKQLVPPKVAEVCRNFLQSLRRSDLDLALSISAGQRKEEGKYNKAGSRCPLCRL